MRKLAHLLQLDRALAYAMIARAWQAVSGPITIVFLVRTLNLAEQGIYYSLTSIVGIQLFFELGLLNILVSLAGNQAPHLHTSNGKERLSELWRGANHWFGWAAVLFSIVAIGVGWSSLSQVQTQLAWQIPLLLMIALTALSVYLSPSQSILEGVGHRDEVYRFRLFQMMLGHVAVWSMLLGGFKLWALVAASAVQAVMMFLLTRVRFSQFVGEVSNCKPTQKSQTNADARAVDQSFSWIRDVLPVQWRLALLSAVSLIAMQFFTLIALWFDSKEAAGRLGMTLSVTGAIQAMALAWIQTKFSLAAQEHGAGNREAAGTMWRKMAVVSTLVLMAALSAAWLVVAALPLAHSGVEKRFITPGQLAILAVGIVANHIVSIEGYYVMSRGSRPLLRAALTGFTSTAIAVWTAGYFFGTDGILWGYMSASSLITLPLHTWAYKRYRNSAGSNSANANVDNSNIV